MKIMKNGLLIITVMLSYLNVFSQEIPISILDRINQVDYIFEGVVLESKSYYTDNNRYIRTSNLVEITKVLKGSITCGTVEIITNGGIIGNKELSISHSLELYKNNMGIFLCDLTNRPLSIVDFYNETNIEKLEGQFENQSFIQYWWDGQNINASDVWQNYDSLALVYNVVEQISGYNFIDCEKVTQSTINDYFPNQSNFVNNRADGDTICFFPKKLAGGINDTLTITGSGFYTVKGSVFFPNANNGGTSMVHIEDEEIAVWNDSVIKLVIPSYSETFTNPTQYGKPAGTGAFTVKNQFGQIILHDTLIIEYSIKNHSDNFPCVISPWQQMNKKFTFRCDTTVANYDNGNMKIVIDKALKDWKCLTGIDWELGTDIIYPANTAFEDTICTISFRDYPDTSTVLAAATVRLDKSPNLTDTDSSFHIYEVDIKINSDKVWFCDTTATNSVPIGEKDFYNVILHELGHAHGLQHVIDVNAIMHFGYTSSQRKIDLPNDLACDKGGNWMAEFTNDTFNIVYDTNYVKMVFDTIRPCSKIVSIIEYVIPRNNGLKIYPNPCSYQLNIQFENDNNQSLQIEIYDINGKKVSEHYIVNSIGFIEDVTSLTNGVYFIRIHSSEGIFLGASKFIKQ